MKAAMLCVERSVAGCTELNLSWQRRPPCKSDFAVVCRLCVLPPTSASPSLVLTIDISVPHRPCLGGCQAFHGSPSHWQETPPQPRASPSQPGTLCTQSLPFARQPGQHHAPSSACHHCGMGDAQARGRAAHHQPKRLPAAAHPQRLHTGQQSTPQPAGREHRLGAATGAAELCTHGENAWLGPLTANHHQHVCG